MDQNSIRNIYHDIREKNELVLARLKKKQAVISLLRLFVFLSGLALTVAGFNFSVALGIGSLLIVLLIFLLLVKKFSDYSDKIAYTRNLIKINSNEIRSMDGDYSAFDSGSELINPAHEFSDDIDLFGSDSLFIFLNRTVTGSGRDSLASWLSDPYILRNEIHSRQEAVRELAGKLPWRQHFMATGLDRNIDSEGMRGIYKWLNEKEIFFNSRYLKFSVFFFPAATLLSMVFVISGNVLPAVFVMMLFINFLHTGLLARRVNRLHMMVSQKHSFLSAAEKLIVSMKNEEFRSSVLCGIKDKLCSEKDSASGRIKDLEIIIRAFDSRLNMIAGLILNGLFLWDLHCVLRLEKWKSSAAKSLPGWMNLLGEIDSLNSLANFAYNNPGYCYPEVATSGKVIEASGMGHPLLGYEIRVVNDFSVKRKGLIIIITGANMAGKSTFLRTVAVNLVLAMTGAPVCAGEMSFSPVRLFTSMRTTDSLSHSESYFYAELKRLKILKEKLENDEDIFFILDEILKGTNSTDKSLGSKLFMRQMVALGGTGLIATHDISLGEMESEFPENIVNKCFEIEIDGENISFDYILRDGITRKMNAAVLMKQMGIA